MHVCENCIEDAALAEFVRSHLVACECSFCEEESTTPSAADLEDVLEFMDEKISEEYFDPNEGMSYISAEGGWQGVVYEGQEILDEIGFGLENEDLFDEIAGHFTGRLFCHDWSALSPSDRVLTAWDRFEKVVEHERRYTFWTCHDDGEEYSHPDHLPPSHMLREVGEMFRKVNRFTILPKEAEIWRARVHDAGFSPNSPKAFTSPPIELARQPNRMSPAGIPMFYGCADRVTAYEETVDLEKLVGKVVSAACFRALRPLCLLDLTGVREPQSFFGVNRDQRHAIRFLQEFTTRLSQPITRDGRQHIEYVPTQVLTEYVRYELRMADGSPLDGIMYNSSRNGGVCYVIFATQDDCLQSKHPVRRQLLGFADGSIQMISKAVAQTAGVGEFAAVR